MTPYRILHVFRAPVGGLFRHVLDLARGQAARGHEVGLLCDSSLGGERAETALDALRPSLALGISRIPMHRLPHPADVVTLLRLAGHCRRTRPNVLHGHGSKGGLYARLAGWPRRDRTAIRAYTPHGGSFHYDKGTRSHALYMAVEKLLEARTDVFLFESGYVRERFDAYVGPTRSVIRTVHNGLEEREFTPIERAPDPFDLIYIGEIRELKGIDTLIDALALLRRDKGVRLTLLCVGAGPDEAALQARARDAGVWDSIAFVPPQPIREALARAKLMIVPSRAESLPYVVLEAAAGGQPLIATKVGGIPDIFGPFAGDLIQPGNPDVLAAKIASVLAQSEEVRLRRAGELSRQVHAGFRIDQMIDGVLEGYAAALSAVGR